MDLELRVPRAEARDRLGRQISEGEVILHAGPPTAARLSALRRDRDRWSAANRQLLYALFATEDVASRYTVFAENTWLRPPSLEEEITFWMGSVRHELGQMHGVLRGLPGAADGVVADSTSGSPAATRSPLGTEVLVVHDGVGEAGTHVASYIRTLGVTASALKREERGTRIMERLQDASVGFAVVLLTAEPDQDPSAPADAEAAPSREAVFGLGFALGHLGGNHVCALKLSNVAEPSAMSGLRCVPLDSDDRWKFFLAKELRTAGFEITARASQGPDR